MTAKELRKAWIDWQAENYEDAEQINAEHCIMAVSQGLFAAAAWLAGIIAEKIGQPTAAVLSNLDTILA